MEKQNMGTCAIWLTGSKKRVQRVVYKIGGQFFVKWYGNMIEVKRGTHSFYSIEEY